MSKSQQLRDELKQYCFSPHRVTDMLKDLDALIAEVRKEALESAAKAVRATCGYVRGPGAGDGCMSECLQRQWDSCRAKPIHELLRKESE